MNAFDDNTSGEASATATRKRPQPVEWDLVYFKVEEIIFPVSPHRLIENSDVFADMFHLPTGEDQRVEGTHKEHPIVLESYDASDFDALLRVLHPTARDVISGAFNLEKEEWVGVLNLSTRWQMKEIRDHAINHLSKMPLSPVEKVALARAHKVAKWLKEGLTEIVTENPIRCLNELEALGLKTACRLLWIRDQISQDSNAQEITVTLGSLGCPNSGCQASMFPNPRNCNNCAQQISVDDTDAIYIYNNSSAQIHDGGTPGAGRARLVLNWQHLRCRHCLGYPIASGTYSCPLCLGTQANFRLLPFGFRQNRNIQHFGPESDVNVNTLFEEEIAGGGWDLLPDGHIAGEAPGSWGYLKGGKKDRKKKKR